MNQKAKPGPDAGSSDTAREVIKEVRRVASPMLSTYFFLILCACLAVQSVFAYALVPALRGFYADMETVPRATERLISLFDWFAGRGPNQATAGWIVAVPGVLVGAVVLVLLLRRVPMIMVLLTVACFLVVVAEMWWLLAPIYTSGFDAISDVSGG